MEELKITSLADLENYAKGDIVELPSFGENKPFIVKLKRPSLLMLAEGGRIPNSLLPTANSLFYSSNKSPQTHDLKETAEVLILMAKASMVEPSYEELEKAGVTLTDQQLIAIFNYTQVGVKSLKTFRKE